MLYEAHSTKEKMLHILVKFLVHYPFLTTAPQQSEEIADIPIKE